MRTLMLTALLAALAAGCGWRKTHLTEAHGRSYDAVFAAQRDVRPTPARAVEGLDPQEAVIVSQAYRERLAPPGAEVQDRPTVFVAPAAREREQPLAPSVPGR